MSNVRDFSGLFVRIATVMSLSSSISYAAVPAGYGGRPYPMISGPSGSCYNCHIPHEVPGRIDFHHYDVGGPNVSFSQKDTAYGLASAGGTAGGRDNDGDHTWPAFFLTWHPDHDTLYAAGVNYPSGARYPVADTAVSDWYIGSCHSGDWTKFTIHVPKAGTYWISSIFAAAAATIQFHISFMTDTRTANTPSITFQGTGSSHAWRQFNDFASVALDSGLQVMQFYNESDGISQDFIYIAADSGHFTLATNRMFQMTAADNTFHIVISDTRAGFSLPDAGRTEVLIIDCGGRKLSDLADRSMSAGRHIFPIPDLLPGVYFLYVKHNGNDAVVKFQNIVK
ncbi:MAG TPA: hypothetical protein VLX68_10665 [Chitinivibrionales bacterium]|nr:hypothetical protein [Chitinivibrionales bacterium]